MKKYNVQTTKTFIVIVAVLGHVFVYLFVGILRKTVLFSFLTQFQVLFGIAHTMCTERAICNMKTCPLNDMHFLCVSAV